MQTCSADGCNRPASVSDLCEAHYKRWSRHGDLEVGWMRELRICTVPGCEREAYVKGMCRLHRARVLRYGSPEPRPRPTRCTICNHPERSAIDLAWANGENGVRLAERFGVTSRQTLSSHAAHAGLPRANLHKPCPVCDHPEIVELDELLEQWASYCIGTKGKNPGCPEEYRLEGIAERFGLSSAQLRKHYRPHHLAIRARFQIARLQALQALER